MLRQVLHVGAQAAMLTHAQRMACALRGEQILHPLVIYLQVAGVCAISRARLLAYAHAREQLLANARYQTRIARCAHHGKRLARSRLAIGKDAGIVTCQVKQRPCECQLLLPI